MGCAQVSQGFDPVRAMGPDKKSHTRRDTEILPIHRKAQFPLLHKINLMIDISLQPVVVRLVLIAAYRPHKNREFGFFPYGGIGINRLVRHGAPPFYNILTSIKNFLKRKKKVANIL